MQVLHEIIRTGVIELGPNVRAEGIGVIGLTAVFLAAIMKTPRRRASGG